MKAVVVDIKNTYAAILSEDGIILTIKDNNYDIGQVIQLNHRKASYTKKLMMIAASAAIVILSAGTWVYASPYLYVSVDVNPSIEYTVNRFDRVLKVNAVNDDGKIILDEISLRNLENTKIESAIAKTVQQIKKAGYFKSNTENGIVITTASEDENRADELADDLHAIVTQEVSASTEEDMIEAYRVGLTRVEEARELGVTPGKLNLVEKLQSYATNSAEINIKEWLSKPVSDIMKATKEYKAATAASNSAITSEETASTTKSDKVDMLQEKDDLKLNKEDKVNKTQNHSEMSKVDQASDIKSKSKKTKVKEKNSNQDKRSTYKTLKKTDSVNSKDKHPKDKTAKQSDKSTGHKPNNRSHSNKASKADKTVNSDDADRQSDHKAKSDNSDSMPGNINKSNNSGNMQSNVDKSNNSNNKQGNAGKTDNRDNKLGNDVNSNPSDSKLDISDNKLDISDNKLDISDSKSDNTVNSDITDNKTSNTADQIDYTADTSDNISNNKDNPGNSTPGTDQDSSLKGNPSTGKMTR